MAAATVISRSEDQVNYTISGFTADFPSHQTSERGEAAICETEEYAISITVHEFWAVQPFSTTVKEKPVAAHFKPKTRG